MSAGKAYLLILLTVQWLALGPVAAALSYLLFFSDGHGLPTDSFALAFVIFGAATVAYIVALRILFFSRKSL